MEIPNPGSRGHGWFIASSARVATICDTLVSYHQSLRTLPSKFVEKIFTHLYFCFASQVGLSAILSKRTKGCSTDQHQHRHPQEDQNLQNSDNASNKCSVGISPEIMSRISSEVKHRHMRNVMSYRFKSPSKTIFTFWLFSLFCITSVVFIRYLD